MLAVALLLRLAMRLGFRRGPALLAMALLAISPYAVWHAQDARMYSMSLALTIATVWLGIETLQRQRVAWGLAYTAAAWLALHTHYYAAYVILALNLFVLGQAIFVASTRPVLVRWLLWQVLLWRSTCRGWCSAASILGGYGGNGDSPALAAMRWSARWPSLPPARASPAEQRLLWAGVAALLLLLGALRLALGTAADRRNLWPAGALPGRAAAGDVVGRTGAAHLQRALPGGGAAALLSADRSGV